MRKIRICDMTVCNAVQSKTAPNFKEKIELVRHLAAIGTDVIALPAITVERTDSLFVRTVAPFAPNSVLSVDAGMTDASISAAWDAVKTAAHPRLCVKIPVSCTTMEYFCHKKPAKMLEFIAEIVPKIRNFCEDAEFVAYDATRAEDEFLLQAISAAVTAGATTVTLCDTASVLSPAEVPGFIKKIKDILPVGVSLSVCFGDGSHMGLASSVCAMENGADEVRVTMGADTCPSYAHMADFIKSGSNSRGLGFGVSVTGVYRGLEQIKNILDGEPFRVMRETEVAYMAHEAKLSLSSGDDINTVSAAVRSLGYDLGEDDMAGVYEAFCEMSKKKQTILPKELDAIIASVAMQAPPVYTLTEFVINSGNVMSATARVTMRRDGTDASAVSMGDGPIDAAFRAIEQIVGTHYELDDFRIESVTEGREAMGSATVKLRCDGKLYAGVGISTDIIGAAVRAYISALNKITYEEV